MLPLTIGVPTVGGNIITGGGLSFIGGSQGRYFRAIEVRTGTELWRARLSAGGNATPMSYIAGGRQFVVLAAGGHAYLGSKPVDYVLAYTIGGRTTR